MNWIGCPQRQSPEHRVKPKTHYIDTIGHRLDVIRPSLYTSGRLIQDERSDRRCFAPALFEERAMSWRCELTGKKPLVGHRVSHSNIKTKRRFMPNLRNVTLISDTLQRKVRVRVTANTLKTVDHRGGLDAFLLKAKDDELAPKMRELKRAIVKKKAAAAS
jgi:large subunit ribosomal protein L28